MNLVLYFLLSSISPTFLSGDVKFAVYTSAIIQSTLHSIGTSQCLKTQMQARNKSQYGMLSINRVFDF